MPKYRITYDTTATLTYRVEAENEEAARLRWQSEAPFDFDHHDFVDGAAGTPHVKLCRLEMLESARDFQIGEIVQRPVSRDA